MSLTAAGIYAAAKRIAPHVIRTPMLRNAMLDHVTGGIILIKPEVLQRTGSFKLRGATNALRKLAEMKMPETVVTYSSGNHGQAIACAAAALGISATIVMPADAPEMKRQATEFWGARVVTYDRASGNREAIAQEIVTTTGGVLIPPYEHEDVIAGQGTVALELAADAASAGLMLNALLAPVGGGGLIAGCALAFREISPATKIHPVEPTGWDDTARSLVSGQRERNDMQGSHFCESLLTPIPGELTFSMNKRLLSGGFAVTDDEVRFAMAFAAKHLKLIAEPGGAVALAAILAKKLDVRGKIVGVVLSGGNV